MLKSDLYLKLLEKDELINKLESIIQQLSQRILELERQLSLNSTNSSKPPISDGLKRQTSLRSNGTKLSGGQIGHSGTTLTQISTPDTIHICTVEKCDSCGKNLSAKFLVGTTKRQVFDIPEPKYMVTEYQAQVKSCTCGKVTTAKFPDGISAPVQYGPRVKAMAVYFANQQLIPEKRIQEAFTDLFDLPISKATISNANRAFADSIENFQNEVLEKLKSTPVKHLDETGFRITGKTKWLHVVSNKYMTHYRVSAKRGNCLDNIKGTLVHDHWKPYYKIEDVKHSLCNAHHLRELKAIVEIDKEVWAGRLSKLLCIAAKQENLTSIQIRRIENIYDLILNEALQYHESLSPPNNGSRKKRVAHNFLIRMKKFKSDVLRFLTDPEVPFTNNQAEQDIRMMKVKQKVSGGFRSLAGAESFCKIRGYISTMRKQGERIFVSILEILTKGVSPG